MLILQFRIWPRKFILFLFFDAIEQKSKKSFVRSETIVNNYKYQYFFPIQNNIIFLSCLEIGQDKADWFDK